MTDLDDEIKDTEETEDEDSEHEPGDIKEGDLEAEPHDFPAHGGHDFDEEPVEDDPHSSFDPATHEDDPHFDLYGVKTSTGDGFDDDDEDEEEEGGYYEMSGADSY